MSHVTLSDGRLFHKTGANDKKICLQRIEVREGRLL